MLKSKGLVAVVLAWAWCVWAWCGVVAMSEETSTVKCFEPVKTGLVRCSDKAQEISVDLNGAEDLYLVVTYGGDAYTADQAIWAEPKLIAADGSEVDLTTVKPITSQVGWGRLFVNTNQNGGKLSIANQLFDKGFWAHGPSMLHFKTAGEYDRFTAKVGIDTRGSAGSVEFQVLSYPPVMPSQAEYTKKHNTAPATSTLPLPPAAADSNFEMNREAADRLLAQGVDKLVFIRRYTLDANHVYTEYVNSRWLPGGGLCVLDLKTGEVKDIVPEMNEGVVNRFDISYDAKKIVFDYKAGPLEGYRIYEVNVDGSGLRQLTFPPENEQELVAKYKLSRGYHHGTDDMHPCYLPDGDIVFTTTRCQFGVLCNSGDDFTVKNLYRMRPDGSEMRPLTNSPLSEASPAMLPDGRIIYHRWEYVDKTAGNAKCLWAMNPDGSGSVEVYGNTICFPETMIYPRPIPGENGEPTSKVVFLGCSHCCPNNAVGSVIVIDMNDDIRSPETMKYVTNDIRAYHHNGFHYQNEKGEWYQDKTGTPGRLFKDPYPLSEKLFIATRKPKGLTWQDPKGYDLVLLDEAGEETPLLKDEAVSCWHPYPLRPRTVPPVRIETARNERLAGQKRAIAVVTDVYVGMNAPEVSKVTATDLVSRKAPAPVPVERGTVKYLRIMEELGRPWAARKKWTRDDRDGMAHSALGEGHLGLKVQHGIVPVEEDGSAKFYVPADRAIYFQALDENFMCVQTERTYVNYQAGETRSCIGCHETPDMAPTGVTPRTPLALMREPSEPMAQPNQATAQNVFDYDRQIQPIWDRHCVECHSAEKAEGGLNLAGDAEGPYSVSYNNLIKLAKSSKQLLGNRRLRDEDTGSLPIIYIPPYMLGSHSSPLAHWLSGGCAKLDNADLQAYAAKLKTSHEDVKISEEELLTITNWLDVNCPYHRSYWGRLNAMYADHPNYRPEVTFEEAQMRTVPESIQQREAAGAK